MEDYKIVRLLFERSEKALDEVSLKYSRLYIGIIREVLCDECDIEECANDVLLAVWNSIPPNKPENLTAYICKIARRIGISKLRYNTSQKRNFDYLSSLSELNECLPESNSVEIDNRQADIVKAVLSDFVRSLDAETQVLFIRRYIYLESVGSLAERFELSENHISVKLFRARKKLKKLLEKEGILT